MSGSGRRWDRGRVPLRDTNKKLLLFLKRTYFFCADDFTISEEALYFNSSSSASDVRCALFETVDDTIVEGTEVFTFQALARNSLDVFTNSSNYVSLSVEDDDGKRTEVPMLVAEHVANTEKKFSALKIDFLWVGPKDT